MKSSTRDPGSQASRGRGRPAGPVPFYRQETRFPVALYLVLTENLNFTKEQAAALAVFFAPKESKKARSFERSKAEATPAAKRAPCASTSRQLPGLEYRKISPNWVSVGHITWQPDPNGSNLLRKAEKVRQNIAGCPQSSDWLVWSQAGLWLVIAGMMLNNLILAIRGICVLLPLGWDRHLNRMFQIIANGRDVDLSASPAGDSHRERLAKLQRRIARRTSSATQAG